MYMVSNWIIDGEENVLYKYTNDVLENSYKIPITKSIGNAAIAVGTNESSIMITCPTNDTVLEFNTGIGQFVRSTTVAKTPLGICEGIPYGDEAKPYFVTSYVSNCVSIIKNGEVVQSVRVGAGPRSLATDGYGRIFVGNYNDGTISVLVPKENTYTNLQTIKVDSNPIAIAINFNDDVYVACLSSIIKIRKNGTVRRFTVHGRPTSLTADKYGNVWATNNTDSSIIKINSNEVLTSYASGSSGPMYICSDKDGDIIVLNTGEKKITRLNEDGSLVNTIPVDYTPIGNGDFIGFLSRINILDDIHVKDKVPITYDDLDDDLKARIDAGVDPGSIVIGSDQVEYDNELYSNTTEALNGIIYEQLGLLSNDILKFEVTPNRAEKGSIINSVTFNYQINKEHGISMAVIDNEIGNVDIDGTSMTVDGLNITEDTEFTMTVNDTKLNTGKATADIKFDIKIYYGMSNENITTPAQVLELLTNTIFVKDDNDSKYEASIKYSNGSGYLYFAVPSVLGITIDDISTAGFKDSNWDTTEVTITTASATNTYTVFKSGYSHVLDTISINVDIDHAK